MRRGPTIHHYLDPGDALGEIMFGIIMTLTFTVGARFFFVRGEFDREELIIGAIGCNIAWGIIDAALYVIGALFFRSQRARFFRGLRETTDDERALASVADQFGLEDQPLNIADADRDQLYRAILAIGRRATPARVRVTRADMVAAVMIFLLVSATAIPSVLPFLLMEDESLALSVSNTIQVALLFIGGYRWGSYTDTAPWKVGATVAILGFGMCMLAVVLGG